MNSTASIFIRSKDGKRRCVAAVYAGKARLKPGIGVVEGKERSCPGGVYWIRWYQGQDIFFAATTLSQSFFSWTASAANRLARSVASTPMISARWNQL